MKIWRSHQPTKSCDRDDERCGKSRNASKAIRKPAAENTRGTTGQRSKHGQAASLDLRDVKLLEVERRQESGQAQESAESNDVDEVEGPAILFPQAAQMLDNILVFDIRRLLRQEDHHA